MWGGLREAGKLCAATFVLASLAGTGCSSESSTKTEDPDPSATAESAQVCSTIDAMEDWPVGPSDQDKKDLLDKIEEARDQVPAPLPDLLDDVAALAQFQLDNRPNGTPVSDEVTEELSALLEANNRAGIEINSWWRHNCGPDSAASPWCDAVAEATLTKSLLVSRLTSGEVDLFEQADGLGPLDQADHEYYLAIGSSAPSAIWPPLDLVIAQYESGSGLPSEGPETDDTDTAKEAIREAVRTDCGGALAAGVS